MKIGADIAIVGSGFGGSLLAMIAQRLGRSVVLLERNRHPRFTIGESSTPLANLLLERLAARCDLRAVAPLAKFGTWQEHHPHIACGLKRGFSFYHHDLDRPWTDSIEHARQLLVAASPHDRIADTHWYRPDFDHFLVEEARRMGAEYFDEVILEQARVDETHAVLHGHRHGGPLEVHTRWIVDATGPRGFLFRALDLAETAFPSLPDTMAVYAHFRNVRSLQTVIAQESDPPYPIDDAALHHVFAGGWIWVLRFNNGVTSAGAALRREFARSLGTDDAASMWQRLLERLPTVREQFEGAEVAHPFQTIPRLAFRVQSLTGAKWSLLPSAAGFVDPLLSTGFTLNLMGLERLARALEEDWATPRWKPALAEYERLTHRELDTSALLVSALYTHMDDFEMFAALARLYFASVSYAETALRLGKSELSGPTFLLSSHPTFQKNFQACCQTAIGLGAQPKTSPAERTDLLQRLRESIEPFDVAGLGNPRAGNWHAVRAEDLFAGATKLRSTREEIERMLARCGFNDA